MHKKRSPLGRPLGVAGLLATFVATLAAPGEAWLHAQSMAEGFSLNRYLPSEPGSEWFSGDSLDLRGSGRLALGLTLDYANKPLVIYDRSDRELLAPVAHQMFLHAGAVVTFWDRLRLGVALPVALVNRGTAGTVEQTSFGISEGAALGDLRLRADVRLLGRHRDVMTVAAGLVVVIPTGKRASFTSDGKARFLPRVMAAGDAGLLTYAALVGIDGRLLDETFGGNPLGVSLDFSLAVGARLAGGALVIGPEVYGAALLRSGHVFTQNDTPLEVLLGAHYTVSDTWRMGVAAGPGLDRALGTPAYRLLASLAYLSPLQPQPEWRPAPVPAPVLDRDGDGVLDNDDACPADAGPPSSRREFNGCPDGDGDGVIDKLDACPKQAGPATEDPASTGCPPPPDADKDGIADKADACPSEPGPASVDPAKNGCPVPPDRDRDGIADNDDACPDSAGDPDPNPRKNGCPKVQVVKGEIKILERIEFDTGKATVRPESEPVLRAVRRALTEHAEIAKVRVEGYTDSRGSAAFNQKLSQARVDSVVLWLVSNGIDPGRLIAKGFGKAHPIASNATEEGRQTNRRVSFIIVDQP